MTGEIKRARLGADHGEVLRWLSQLCGPIAVAYEAGPTGFGLARALTAAGVRCEEGARDLVRARDDVRGELMRARHRVSKLLLRQGIVYCDGRGWTLRHHAWL